MHPRARATILCIACTVLSACSINKYHIGAEIPAWDDTAAPNNLSETLKRLGPPLRISSLPNGYVLAWEHWEIDERSLGLSLKAVGADLLSIDWGKAKTDGEFLVITFDSNHRVVDSQYSDWQTDVSGGQGIQALVSIVSVVDVDDLTVALPYHDWGGSMLAPLPVSLNRNQDLSSGSSGIEQRGTPTAVGQHSLEMGSGN
jgi:hypothetical protein